MSTIPKDFFNTPQPIKDKVCEVFTKEQSPYMYDSLRQAAYYGYQLATDGREELERNAEIVRLKGIIGELWDEKMSMIPFDRLTDDETYSQAIKKLWQQFKTKNNL